MDDIPISGAARAGESRQRIGGENHLPATGRVLDQRGDVDEVVRVDDPVSHRMMLQVLHRGGVDTHSNPQPSKNASWACEAPTVEACIDSVCDICDRTCKACSGSIF
jgi:hypothetical protein